MCKIMAIVGIDQDPKAQRLAWEFVKAARPWLTAKDDDGFGYAILDAGSGELRGEKWLDPKDAFKRRRSERAPEGLRDVLTGRLVEHTTIGKGARRARTPISTVIAHARMATCGVSLANVHPFVRTVEEGRELALIHNGVVGSVGMDLSGSDKCDSAGILNAYAAAEAHLDPGMWQVAADDVLGSYACAVLMSGPGGHVDLFRNDGSYLTVTEIEGIGLVWCTTREIVVGAARDLGLRIRGSWSVDPGVLIRLNPEDGQVISKTRFEAAKYTMSRPTTTVLGNGSGSGWAGYGGWQRDSKGNWIEKTPPLASVANTSTPTSAALTAEEAAFVADNLSEMTADERAEWAAIMAEDSGLETTEISAGGAFSVDEPDQDSTWPVIVRAQGGKKI